MNKTKVISGGIILIVLSVGLFFVLKQSKPENSILNKIPQRQIQSSPVNEDTSPPNTRERLPLPSGASMPNIPEGSQPFFGTVSNLEEESFSIKSPMGEFKIIFTESTAFEGGSSSDLKNDLRIGGYGTKNTDGTVSALQIQINPSMPERGQFPSR